MIIKFCGNCKGQPYTKDLNSTVCSVCGSSLQMEAAEDSTLAGRPMIMPTNNTPVAENPFSTPFSSNVMPYVDPFNEKKEPENDIVPAKPTDIFLGAPETGIKNSLIDEEVKLSNKTNNRVIRGRISQYSSTGKEDGEYRRLLPVKIYQALVYRQRIEDVLHRFTVRVEPESDVLGYQSYIDIPVNVHGTISDGLQLVDNSEVEVHGKYKNGVLMADSIYVITNGYKSKVSFQHSVKAITYGILSVIMFAFICYVAASSNGDFFANLKEFCIVWLVMAVILSVIYLITSLTQIGILARMFAKDKKMSFPIFGILLISLAFAFLFVSAFGSFAGFGSYLSGWIYSLIPIIIILVAIFFIIKSFFKI